jgi:outer membrane protein OmpA-like peptidoglycan-associated protein
MFALYSAVLLVSCDGGTPYSRYGYEAKMKSQDAYIRKLGDDNYIGQREAWNEKLDSRKGEFNDMLKRQYLEFAQNLALDKEYTDASYFRRKGLDANRSNFDVFPENPSKWNVKDAQTADELRTNRLKLIDALVGYTPVVEPAKSAKAIVYFDCWLQQSQSKVSPHNNQNCKENFKSNYNAIAGISTDIRDKDIVQINEKYKWIEIEKRKPEENELYTVENAATKSSEKKSGTKTVTTTTASATSETSSDKKSTTYVPGKKVATTTTTTAITANGQPAVKTQTTTTVKQVKDDTSFISDQSDKTPDLVYVAYFTDKTDAVSDIAKAELDKTVAQIQKNTPKSVAINGHTDRSFDSQSSLIMSKRRADAVRTYLISKGISKDIIHTYGFGKTDNLVANKEGEEVQANNRAEVVFKGSTN